MMMLPFADVLERLPVPKLRRARMARARLDAIIYGMIADRRPARADHGDLLSMLLAAQDERATAGGMTDVQVRDEAMTIFLAGHETTANALTWTWYLLSGAPSVEAKCTRRSTASCGRLPTPGGRAVAGLRRARATEAMRLYPPAWIIGRRAIVDYPVGGYLVPARSIVVVEPSYVLQRDARE